MLNGQRGGQGEPGRLQLEERVVKQGEARPSMARRRAMSSLCEPERGQALEGTIWGEETQQRRPHGPLPTTAARSGRLTRCEAPYLLLHRDS